MRKQASTLRDHTCFLHNLMALTCPFECSRDVAALKSTDIDDFLNFFQENLLEDPIKGESKFGSMLFRSNSPADAFVTVIFSSCPRHLACF
jgi:hypothetical protein